MKDSEGYVVIDSSIMTHTRGRMSVEAGIVQYCGYMEGVKHRISAIETMGSSPMIELLNGVIQIESIYLQFRKILELIAMASLITNKDAYSTARASFATDWHAARILKGIATVNPSYYPQPVVETSHPDGGKSLEPRAEGLTEEEFGRLYDRCGDALHTANPFGTPINYKSFTREVSEWRAKIIALLTMHKVHLLGDTGFWLIQMAVIGSNKIHYSKWELVDEKR